MHPSLTPFPSFPLDSSLAPQLSCVPPWPPGTVSGVEHNDKEPNSVAGNFSEGRLVMQKTDPTTNKFVKFIGTFHMGKIAGTWAEDGGAEGTFLVVYQPTPRRQSQSQLGARAASGTRHDPRAQSGSGSGQTRSRSREPVLLAR